MANLRSRDFDFLVFTRSRLPEEWREISTDAIDVLGLLTLCLVPSGGSAASKLSPSLQFCIPEFSTSCLILLSSFSPFNFFLSFVLGLLRLAFAGFCIGWIVALPFRYSTVNLLFPRWDHAVSGNSHTQRSVQTIAGSTLKMPYDSQRAERPGEKGKIRNPIAARLGVSLILRLNSQLIAKGSDFGRPAALFGIQDKTVNMIHPPADPNLAVHSLGLQPTRRGCHSSSITAPVVCKRGGKL
jgi:hypothetical protein